MTDQAPAVVARRDRIVARLTAALSPTSLAVDDRSERHRGHGGWQEGGETHFSIEVVSSAFAGKSRLDRQRLVNDLLAAEFEGGLHALSIRAKAPGE